LLVSCASPKPVVSTPQVVKQTVIVKEVVTPTPANLIKLNVPLGWLNNDEFTALQVAQALGYFAEGGLEVNLISGGGSTGFDPNIAVNGFDSSVKIGVPAAMSLVLKAKAEGLDLIAIAALTQFEPGGFIALTKNGTKADGPCDFKGKIVAMQTEAMWYLDALGKMCDTGPLVAGKDFQAIPAGWTPDCLTSGQCDFYCGWSTNQVFVLNQQGLKEGVDYNFFLASKYVPFYFADVIVTTRAYADANPDIVRAFVQASMKGLQYTMQHPDEAAKITAGIPGVSLDHAIWRLPAQNKLAVSNETKEFGLGYMDLTKVDSMIKFLFDHGQIKQLFQASEVVDNSFLSPDIK